jgi:predicted enzyme related to lactoylglutathione lyase
MTTDPTTERTYPPGVPCLIDTEQPDPDAAAAFYGRLFGWEFENKLPPGAEDKYLVASLRGATVAAIASPTPALPGPPSWNTYVCVDDADAATATAVAHGARLLMAPVDAGPPGAVAGRWAALADPEGAHIRLWQPGYRQGAQLVNAPATWNSSDLVTPDADRSMTFYGAVFGWEAQPVEFGGDGSYMLRRPGYGDFLAIRDHDIRRRHAEPGVPEGFSDAIGWMTTTGAATASDASSSGRSARWTVTFSVEGTEAVVERAEQLGATVVSPPTDHGGGIVRVATLRDPQGAEFVVSTYDPAALSA